MNNNILLAANLYAEGLKKVIARREQWLQKHKELQDYLKEIAKQLNEKVEYKQGFFVDSLHAFNEEINGTCTEIPSLTFRSGGMPMLVAFSNAVGDSREYTEYGFHITFTPTITGEIIIMLTPHYSELNKTPPQSVTLGVINEVGSFTMDMADQVIAKGIEAAFYSSFTGVTEAPQENEVPQMPPPPPHNPIGFKRYETTE